MKILFNLLLIHIQLEFMNGYFLASPILIINLAGEMMYILDQRLKAQSIGKQPKIHLIINYIYLKESIMITELILSLTL